MSYDTIVQVNINHIGTSVGVLGQIARDSYEAVKEALIKNYYESDAEYYAKNTAGDQYHEELNFLSHVIQHSERTARENDTSVLGWGYFHKNLNITDFIENLAPFWKAYFKQDLSKHPIMVMYVGGDMDKTLEGYWIGVPPETNLKKLDLVAYDKFEIQFSWSQYELGFSGAKRI